MPAAGSAARMPGGNAAKAAAPLTNATHMRSRRRFIVGIYAQFEQSAQNASDVCVKGRKIEILCG
jgi:hypothetical protein